MFTIADIREIAIQIEKNGEEAYRQAAEAVSDPAICEIFTWMADEEKRHGQWFATLTSTDPLTEEQLELEKMGRQLLQEMVGDQTFSLDQKLLADTTEFGDALAQSKAFEQDTIMFYEFLLNLINDEQARAQLDTIIKEERRHIKQLEEMSKCGPDCSNLALI